MTKKKRKAMLVAAIMSALEVGSIASSMGYMVTATEAAEVHPEIYIGGVSISSNFVSAMSGGSDGGGTEYATHTWSGGGGKMVVRWNESANRYGVYYVLDREDTSGASWTGSKVHIETDVYTDTGCNKLSWVNYGGRGVGNGGHYWGISGGNIEEAHTIAKMLNENIKKGIFMSEDDVLRIMKEHGVDATGSTVNITKNVNTKNVNVSGTATTSGGVTAGGDVYVKGGETIDKTLHVKDTGTFDKDVVIHGNETIDKNVTVKGSETINGNSHVKGTSEVDKDQTVHGSETVDKNLTVKDNTTLGNDKTKDVLNVNAKTNLHGDTVIGDNAGDKLTVNATSEFAANATFNKNVEIKGDTTMGGKLDVNGDSHLHGNVEIDKDIISHGNQTIDGNSIVHGNQTIDKNLYVHGNEEVDGDIHVHGSQEIDKNQTVHGNQHVNGGQEVDKNQVVHGDQTVDGDSRIHGNQDIDKDLTVYGNTNLKGDLQVENDTRLLNNVQIGDDKDKDKLDVWAKTNLHGDTTVGDNEKDKFVINATSEFKADATFNKDVSVKGSLEIEKDLTVHGEVNFDKAITAKEDAEFEKSIHVKGDSEVDGDSIVHGNGTVDGDFEVKGNTSLGDDKNTDKLDVNAKAHLHGDTTIGDNENDKFIVNASSEFKSNADFDKDVRIKGNLETDGNSTTYGNSLVYGNAGVVQDFYVGGDTKVDGDIYGRSFNVGNEKYIDQNGINANEHKIRNVADGEIGPNSLDAVNGRQLWNTRESLQHNINQVGAQTAAMANLHPMDFEYGDKVSIAAAVGGYQNQQAFALGAFVKPTQKSMLSLSGTLGMSQNMYGIGYTQKFGKKADFENMTQTQLQDELVKLSKDAAEIKEHDKQIKAENETLRKASRALAESIDTNSAEITHLKATEQQIREKNKALTDKLNQNEANDKAMAVENKQLQGEVGSLKEQVKSLSVKNSYLEKSLAEIGNAYKALMEKVNNLATELKKK